MVGPAWSPDKLEMHLEGTPHVPLLTSALPATAVWEGIYSMHMGVALHTFWGWLHGTPISASWEVLQCPTDPKRSVSFKVYIAEHQETRGLSEKVVS